MLETIVKLNGYNYAVTSTGECFVIKGRSLSTDTYRQRITSAPKIKRLVKLAANTVPVTKFTRGEKDVRP